MAYDYKGALAAGANKDDVLNYLASTTGYDVGGAIGAGANPDDVLAYMSSIATPPVQQEDGFLKSLAKDIIRPAARIGVSTLKVAQGASSIVNNSAEPDYTAPVNVPFLGPTTAIGVTGGAGQRLKDVVGVGLEGASYLPLGAGVKTAATALGVGGRALLGAGRAALEGAIGGSLSSAGRSLQENNTLGKVTVDSIVGAGLGSLVGGVIGGASGAIGKTRAAKQSLEEIISGTNEGVSTLENKLASQYRDILRPSGRLSAIEARYGKDTPTFLAKEGVEVKANGRLLDVDPAIEQLDTKYIAEARAFQDVLESDPSYISVDEWARRAKENLPTIGKAKDAAIKEIDDEVSALKTQFDTGIKNTKGETLVPVSIFNTFKTAAWDKTKGFNTPDMEFFKQAYFQLGHLAKEMIEETVTDAPIRAMNKRLGDFQSAIYFLEKSRNKSLPGSFFGRMGARVTGAIVGSSLGPLQSVAGAITADQIANVLQDPTVRTYVVRELLKRVRKAQGEEIIQQAQQIIENRIARRSSIPRLPAPAELGTAANPRIMPDPTQFNPDGSIKQPVVQAVPAQKLPPSVNPRTGRMQKTYSSLPASQVATKTANTTVNTNIPTPSNKSGVKSIPNRQGGFISTAPFKNTGDLTTKILKDLEGKTTVSKQYILDATNRGELKQAERDLTRQVLDTMPDGQVNVADFAQRLQSELLPLTPSKQINPRYESVSLPSELRGNVKNYSENVYESPIKTSAGEVHFSGYKAGSRRAGQDEAQNYFGHTRIEDMADNKTRRVIEVQSDLYQKGRLERETDTFSVLKGDESVNKIGEAEHAKRLQARKKEVAKLSQYSNPTAHFRMVREELKKAAQDGKTKLQFPTGETAMKIEGLGQNSHQWNFYEPDGDGFRVWDANRHPEKLKVGQEISNSTTQTDWIITDVLGDGKFKAVPKYVMDNIQAGKDGWSKPNSIMRAEETFDISGKVDTNNPIYKFYEKDLQKYLTKFDGKRVVDDKGVSWIEVPVKKEYGTNPVEAFGRIGINPLTIGALGSLGAVATAGQLKSVMDKQRSKPVPLTQQPSKLTFGTGELSKRANEFEKDVFIKDRDLLLPLSAEDAMIAAGVLYGELSNREPSLQREEARMILNTAINRSKELGRPLKEVLTQPNQYQAYNGKQYKNYLNSNFDVLSRPKAKLVEEIVQELLSGNFKDNTGGRKFYIHDKNGNVILKDGNVIK